MTTIERIREHIRSRDYYLSSHAEEEMQEDGLDRVDVENVIVHGAVEKKMTQDVRGTRYRIRGPAKDGTIVHVICRFKESGALIIITVYK